jgi:hypothetical protein
MEKFGLMRGRRKLFECLAKGLAVMEGGNEEVEGKSWGEEHNIVHLDLKDQNGGYIFSFSRVLKR